MKESYIYITSNKNRTVLYIGVTSDLIKRIEDHKNGKGSIFTKKYNVNELLYFEKFNAINLAISREKQLKKWHSDWKWNLIKESNPNLLDLWEFLQP
ncbi:MAG: GIY-YIG nuclease family protein [Lutibacter sp.]|uniref:GIY-YIG nuclease family protein n=1 Tax=Lutibacter sp. TaxID=1925666 RepID=UPI00299DB6F8|nr:GIY-YIG nuclease family protein [Lutibacter sp.]MDX1828793.1 GIY-YIG nuclease family protein [Lutibacter sp.]